MNKTILMGQHDTAKNPELLSTTLGSCVAIILFDKETKNWSMAHIMLPNGKDEKDSVELPGKYADTALPALLKMMNIPQSQASTRLTARLTGGANMLGVTKRDPLLQIGDRNIEAVKKYLKEYGIAVLAEDLGGTKGRRVTIDTVNNKIFVNQIGESKKELI